MHNEEDNLKIMTYISDYLMCRPMHGTTVNEPMDWRRAAEAWAKLKNRESGMNTPRQDGRTTPRQHR